jgi:predicted ATP-binding protein involved in virulence
MSDVLRINSVELENFRCFSAASLALHPKLTVLVANNGAGKTAALDSIGVALTPVLFGLRTGTPRAVVSGDDLRQVWIEGRLSVSGELVVAVRGTIDGQPCDWAVRRGTESGRARLTGESMKRAVRAIHKRFAGHVTAAAPPPPLPLIAHYGTGRLWAEHRLTNRRRRADLSIIGRLAGYQDAIESASSFKAFVAWYGEMVAALRGPTPSDDRSARPLALLSAVRKAVHEVLAPCGWTELDWRDVPAASGVRGSGQLVVSRLEHGEYPVAWMSDGIRNMIALVGDIAHRCARLNPHFGEDAAQYTPGVVLIDEIDMHLHPAWQQAVLQDLCRVFPQLQFIVTTHSPQVLSTVDASSIRLLDLRADGVAGMRSPEQQTRGVESADILAAIMGVDPVPRVKEAQDLRRLRAMIEDGQLEQADFVELRARLTEHFGERHPVMLDCARLIRFADFKLRQRRGESGNA